jgi:hypothetical protein
MAENVSPGHDQAAQQQQPPPPASNTFAPQQTNHTHTHAHGEDPLSFSVEQEKRFLLQAVQHTHETLLHKAESHNLMGKFIDILPSQLTHEFLHAFIDGRVPDLDVLRRHLSTNLKVTGPGAYTHIYTFKTLSDFKIVLEFLRNAGQDSFPEVDIKLIERAAKWARLWLHKLEEEEKGMTAEQKEERNNSPYTVSYSGQVRDIFKSFYERGQEHEHYPKRSGAALFSLFCMAVNQHNLGGAELERLSLVVFNRDQVLSVAQTYSEEMGIDLGTALVQSCNVAEALVCAFLLSNHRSYGLNISTGGLFGGVAKPWEALRAIITFELNKYITNKDANNKLYIGQREGWLRSQMAFDYEDVRKHDGLSAWVTTLADEEEIRPADVTLHALLRRLSQEGGVYGCISVCHNMSFSEFHALAILIKLFSVPFFHIDS